MKPTLHIKRAYEKPLKKDGYRVLVDRLWPRGVSKKEAVLDEWVKELAPSAQLRKWFDHDPERWKEFQEKYRAELKRNKALSDFVKQHQDQKTITLVYGAKDTRHTHALILQEYLEKQYTSSLKAS